MSLCHFLWHFYAILAQFTQKKIKNLQAHTAIQTTQHPTGSECQREKRQTVAHNLSYLYVMVYEFRCCINFCTYIHTLACVLKCLFVGWRMNGCLLASADGRELFYIMARHSKWFYFLWYSSCGKKYAANAAERLGWAISTGWEQHKNDFQLFFFYFLLLFQQLLCYNFCLLPCIFYLFFLFLILRFFNFY